MSSGVNTTEKTCLPVFVIVVLPFFHRKLPGTSMYGETFLFCALPPERVLPLSAVLFAKSSVEAVGFVEIIGVALFTVTLATSLRALAVWPLSTLPTKQMPCESLRLAVAIA